MNKMIKNIIKMCSLTVMLAVAFSTSAFAADEVKYTTDEGTQVGSFEDAINNVKDDGEIVLLSDVLIDSTKEIQKDVTITSADKDNPCKIYTETPNLQYMLSFYGNVKLKDVIIDGGSEEGVRTARALIGLNDGKILTLGEGAVIQNNLNATEGGTGSGICVINGTLIMDGGTIQNCSSYYGGGIGLVEGELQLDDGYIKDCSAFSDGGGIYAMKGNIYLNGVTIDNCTAKSRGGGILMGEAGKVYLKIDGGTIQNCTADGGGAVASNGSKQGNEIVMISGLVTENKSTNATYNGGGGGFYVSYVAGRGIHNNSFTLWGGTISYNEAAYPGGGIFFNDPYCVVEIKGGEIIYNEAKMGGGIYSSQMKSIIFEGGEITNNHTTSYGGGVLTAPIDKLYFNGPVIIKDNTSDAAIVSDNYFIQGATSSFITDVRIGGSLDGGEVWVSSNISPASEADGKLYIIEENAGYSITDEDYNVFNCDDENLHILWDKDKAEFYLEEHKFGSEWEKDDSNHWKECEGCHIEIEKSQHNFGEWTIDKAPTETQNGREVRYCKDCNYEQEREIPALGAKTYTLEIPVKVIAEITGDKKPSTEVFDFGLYDLAGNEFYSDSDFSIEVKRSDFDGDTASVDAVFSITVIGNSELEKLKDGFVVKMTEGDTKGWTYSDTEWKDVLDMSFDTMKQEYTINGYDFYESEDGIFYPTSDDKMVFEVSYKQKGSSGSDEEYYTLRYDCRGGEDLEDETRNAPWVKRFSSLPTPYREGWVFEGWYLDEDLTEYVDGDVDIDRKTVVLYADWSRQKEESQYEEDDSGVSQWLDTQIHTSYLNGYTDGSFGPDRPMTRGEVAQMFYNLLIEKNVPVTVNFDDVQDDAWYAKAVNTLASLGILSGKDDNKYYPDDFITRAEFTSIAMRFSNGDISGENVFTDVNNGDWFYDHVVGSVKYGWINGYPDNTFRPEKSITRAEVTVIVNRMLSRSADKEYAYNYAETLNGFYDVDENHWAYYHILEATNDHEHVKNGENEIWLSAN